MKYNILAAPLTLAILLTGTPSFGMDSEIPTKTNISKLAPKVEDLSNSLNTLEKWQLVDSLKDRGANKPISVNKKPKGFKILGDNYTFYATVPDLMNPEFHNTTFSFSTILKSKNPGVYIQYWDGKNVVNFCRLCK